MLSDHEQRVLDELERQVTGDVHGPGTSGPWRHRPRDGGRSVGRPVIVVGWICVLLVITGVLTAALALAAATALGWSLWRYWPLLSDDGATTAVPLAGGEAADRPPRRRPGSEWLSQYLTRLTEEK